MDKFKKNIFGQQIRDFDPQTVRELIQSLMNRGSRSKQMISDKNVLGEVLGLSSKVKIRSSQILEDIRRRSIKAAFKG